MRGTARARAYTRIRTVYEITWPSFYFQRFRDHAGVQRFFDFIDRSGMLYTQRWSEQSVWELAISMFMRDEALFQFGRMAQIHHWGGKQ